jgi:Domain of unknown function (DUF4388)
LAEVRDTTGPPEIGGGFGAIRGKLSASYVHPSLVETRLLILNSDPVFQDRALAMFDAMRKIETRIVRTLADAVCILMREDFDLFIVEGEAAVAIEQAVHTRQHFPSLKIVCLPQGTADRTLRDQASEQNIELTTTDCSDRRLRHQLRVIVSAFERTAGPAAEGIDPCHSLVGNLNQFSAADVLQMSCMSQSSGRFTFKSGRGNSEIYLQHGMVRHAVYGPVEGEPAVAEIFRWRQGRFYFEEGIISQVQTVTRPWAHLLIDNLQKLDETLQLVSIAGQR